MSATTYFRSDQLQGLRPLFREEGWFAQFGDILQISLILDADAVQREIRWIGGSRVNEDARSRFRETLDAGGSRVSWNSLRSRSSRPGSHGCDNTRRRAASRTR